MSHEAKPTTKNSALFYQSELRRPLFSRSEGIYLWDINGKCYIDGSSGAMVSNIGHSNPSVLAAMAAQMNKGTFAYRLHFENEPAEKLADELVARSPAGLDKVFFVSGGSEAVESCLKLGRQWALATGQSSRHKVISCFPSYHGCTFGALSVTGYTPLSEPFDAMMQAMPKIPAPRCYLERENHSEEDDDALGLHYAENLRNEILKQGADTVLAFIYEPVGGASTGALVAPSTFHRRIQEICREFGILLILDEVMTGVGRTGKFLAAEHWQIEPDMIALSKGLAAGYSPLGAMLASNRLVDPVLANGGFMHGFTSAGNPLSCAAGLAVLNELDSLDLVANCEQRGIELKAGLEKLMSKYPFIGDVRGKGLLQAFELVSERKNMTPLPKELNAHLILVDIAYENGLIIYSRRTRGGVEGDHFLICPPLSVSSKQICDILSLLETSLEQFADVLLTSLNTYGTSR